VLALALIIFVDVSGRYLFSMPLLGATEIIKNSVVSITFLQIPLAIYRGGMIRTTLIYDMVGPNWIMILGVAIVVLLVPGLASWLPGRML